ncbi:hypothetical protein CDE51_12125 [Pasteurella multocida]|nr:hypothetical protein CDE51_12125 [Pasteurella multocida]
MAVALGANAVAGANNYRSGGESHDCYRLKCIWL